MKKGAETDSPVLFSSPDNSGEGSSQFSKVKLASNFNVSAEAQPLELAALAKDQQGDLSSVHALTKRRSLTFGNHFSSVPCSFHKAQRML